MCVCALACSLWLCGGVGFAATTGERHVGAAVRRSLAVIVYGNFAQVRDTRRLAMTQGENRVVFDDVSPQMAPETAYLRDVSSGAPIWVREQDFETAVLTPDAILAHAIGQTVLVIHTLPVSGQQIIERARVLSPNGPILQFANRIETQVPPDSRIAYTSIPQMRLSPAFLMDFTAPETGDHTVALNYITGGLSWSADYVAKLNADNDAFDIDGFITLHNDSGMKFDDAEVSVVAGSVQRVQAQTTAAVYSLGAVTARSSEVYASNASRATRQPISEFYQYRLPQRTSLAIGETKQSLLLFARAVPVTRLFEAVSTAGDFRSQSGDPSDIPVNVSLRFDNEGHGLGVPLPSGVVHLYQNDDSGQPVFVGEDAIDNTPRKATLSLSIGQSFDVTVRRVQTEYHEIPFERAPTQYLSFYRVVVKNAKTKPVTVDYGEEMSGDWQIPAESLTHKILSSTRVVWNIPVPAQGQTVLTFEVVTR